MTDTDKTEYKVHGFNTGRMYQAHGQRISWAIINNKVYFNDHSRGIWGILRYDCFGECNMTPQILMHDYDRGQYDMDREWIANKLNAGEWPEFHM